MTHACVAQKHVKFFPATFTPHPKSLQHDIDADLVSVTEAVDEGLLGVVSAHGRAVDLVRLDPLMKRGPGEPEEARGRGRSARRAEKLRSEHQFGSISSRLN